MRFTTVRCKKLSTKLSTIVHGGNMYFVGNFELEITHVGKFLFEHIVYSTCDFLFFFFVFKLQGM